MATQLPMIAFAADCLKFTAVPALAFEMLSDERRVQVDASIETKARIARIVSAYAFLTVVIAIPTALVIGWNVYMAGVILFASVMVGYLVLLVGMFRWNAVIVIVGLLFMAVGIFQTLGQLALWWFESGLTLSSYSPYLWLEHRAADMLGVSGSLYHPDQSFADLLLRRANLNLRVYGNAEGSSWSLAFWLDFSKFFRLDFYWAAIQLGVTRIAGGLFVVVFLALNLGVLVLALSVPVLLVSEAIHRLYAFSDWLKLRLQLKPRTRAPLVAAILLGLGETLSFVLSVRSTFW